MGETALLAHCYFNRPHRCADFAGSDLVSDSKEKNGPRRVVPEAERDWGRYMPEMLFSPDFWKAQWGVIWSAPWVFLPAILIAFAVGWKWKATNDDAEIRGLRADRDASVSRLDLVKENALQEAKELADLRHDIFQIKTQLQTGAQPIALATEAERKAITLTSSNNAIREIATIEHRPVRIIQKS